MAKLKLRRQLLGPYLLLVLAAFFAVSGYASYRMRQTHLERTIDDLRIHALLLRSQLPVAVSADSVYNLIRPLAAATGLRITVVAADGLAVTDSDAPERAEDLSFLPEIREALAGRTGIAQRFSSISRTDMLFVAVPHLERLAVRGAVRVAMPMVRAAPGMLAFDYRIAVAALVFALIAFVLTFLLAQRLSRSIEAMQQGAGRFAGGEFTQKLAIPATLELGNLAESLNDMAEQLDEKIRTITRQRNEQDAILASLREGVLALNHREQILFINRAAEGMLGVDSGRAQGRLLQEAVRISELQHFTAALLRRAGDAEAEIAVAGDDGPVLRATGTKLCDADGRRVGALIVLNDITRLRRLETLRRDFVANVSHELKTPITAIKGSVETLSEGAWHDAVAAQGFLERIARNTERLNAIIDDLLLLSRIERDDEQGLTGMQDVRLQSVAAAAAAQCAARAEAKAIALNITGDDDPAVRGNPVLLEQALINLLDNAITYSEQGRTVEISFGRTEGEAVVRVRDYGCGIAAIHLPRLFERFYRVDPARGRAQGGTGLGLSIVKHIVQSHGGRITVDSKAGKGSTFSIYLPLA